MNNTTKKQIGKDLYIMSAGMITMQTYLFFANKSSQPVIIVFMLAVIIILIGKLLRS